MKLPSHSKSSSAVTGLLKNIKVLNNTVITQGYHFITFNGLLSGSIGGNRLQSTGKYIPKIYLNPARIGGNMADDGMVCLLSFADATASYAPISVPSPNTALLADGTSRVAEIVDGRNHIPAEFEKFTVGLKNFRYQAYFDEYNNLTFGAYKSKYPTEYANLCAWLRARIAEYNPASPRLQQDPLGAATSEQTTTIRPLLLSALASATGGKVDVTRIPELADTAIRSFVMKQLAIRYGEVQPLVDLGAGNARREAMLKFLLTAAQLGKKERVGRIDCEVLAVGLAVNTPVISQKFKLYFEGEQPIPGITTPTGRILMEGLPLAPYILHFDNANFVTTYTE
jgi:hypothetical protein